MAPRHLDTAKERQSGGDTQTEAFGKLCLLSDDRKDIADLAAIVERALEMADASGFDRVGIDLCSALERLRKGEPPVWSARVTASDERHAR
jgi:hypothetical protein